MIQKLESLEEGFRQLEAVRKNQRLSKRVGNFVAQLKEEDNATSKFQSHPIPLQPTFYQNNQQSEFFGNVREAGSEYVICVPAQTVEKSEDCSQHQLLEQFSPRPVCQQSQAGPIVLKTGPQPEQFQQFAPQAEKKPTNQEHTKQLMEFFPPLEPPIPLRPQPRIVQILQEIKFDTKYVRDEEISLVDYLSHFPLPAPCLIPKLRGEPIQVHSIKIQMKFC